MMHTPKGAHPPPPVSPPPGAAGAPGRLLVVPLLTPLPLLAAAPPQLPPAAASWLGAVCGSPEASITKPQSGTLAHHCGWQGWSQFVHVRGVRRGVLRARQTRSARRRARITFESSAQSCAYKQTAGGTYLSHGVDACRSRRCVDGAVGHEHGRQFAILHRPHPQPVLRQKSESAPLYSLNVQRERRFHFGARQAIERAHRELTGPYCEIPKLHLVTLVTFATQQRKYCVAARCALRVRYANRAVSFCGTSAVSVTI